MKKHHEHKSCKTVPNILLVGAGRFAMHYLRSLKQLVCEGMLTLAGVAVRASERPSDIIYLCGSSKARNDADQK